MDILMASAELAPVVRVGELADAVASLAKTLGRLGHRVTVALPRYRAVEQSGLQVARRLSPLAVQVRGESVPATIYDARLGSAVELVLIDVPGFYDRDGIYGELGSDYPDNARRFGLFCRALVELAQRRLQEGRPFDVVHAHDWAAALLPFLLRRAGPPSVLTVHDGAHQGRCDRQAIDQIGLDWGDFHPEALEFYGELNLLKAGVVGADAVAAVSPTYALELQTPAGGAGLDGLFRSRSAALVGVANGIDYARWSPATDPHLGARFDAEDPSGKGRCRAALRHALELGHSAERPLALCWGRPDQRGGADLLVEALPRMLRGDVQVVVAGTGEQTLQAELGRLAAAWPEQLRALGAVDDAMEHRLVAAADLVLLPARAEPGGLRAQYAQRYGALPVARATGGLKDAIVDCDAELETGTGFLFDEPTAADLHGAFARAVSAVRRPRWPALRRRVMRLDLGWERPAQAYLRLYEQAARARAARGS
ncbi:MAG: glycogen synthase [Deltaproteobacteria bacterium]|nr:glycogen synthase [Deltaproteobacteria bacterium]